MALRSRPSIYLPSPLSYLSVSYDIDNERRVASSSSQSLYAGAEQTHSPEENEYGNGSGSDSSLSDSTLSNEENGFTFGHPLQRMGRAWNVVRLGSDPALSGSESFPESLSGSQKSSESESLLRVNVDYDSLVDCVDKLLLTPELINEQTYITLQYPKPNSTVNNNLMVRILPQTSEELRLLLELNRTRYRADPWNPTPYLLCSVDHADDVYVCFEHLTPFNKPPLRTVAHYLDFFGQILEGLSFLHELSIVNLSCSKPTSFMVDLSAGSEFDSDSDFDIDINLTESSSEPDAATSFDRTKFPVKYYLTDFTKATQLSGNSSSNRKMFLNDVRDLGTLFDGMITNIPQLTHKFKSLISAMTARGFSADDARKLYEALCHSLEASVFDMPVTTTATTTDITVNNNSDTDM
ncbi:hypothetical protein AX17_003726 [Amanita inopinata Kibby_2008]|nr:hypothetical protein AX17_003726 [Amanita inopinata Kibby_2008]